MYNRLSCLYLAAVLRQICPEQLAWLSSFSHSPCTGLLRMNGLGGKNCSNPAVEEDQGCSFLFLSESDLLFSFELGKQFLYLLVTVIDGIQFCAHNTQEASSVGVPPAGLCKHSFSTSKLLPAFFFHLPDFVNLKGQKARADHCVQVEVWACKKQEKRLATCCMVSSVTKRTQASTRRRRGSTPPATPRRRRIPWLPAFLIAANSRHPSPLFLCLYVQAVG